MVGRPRKVAEQPIVSITADEPMAATEAQDLQAYIAAREGKYLNDGIVLSMVSHPQETPRVFDGKYSGIRITNGPMGCMWSDGTTE